MGALVGLLLLERWVRGKRPFELLIEAMDSGCVEIENEVPQGLFRFERDGARMVLRLGAETESAPLRRAQPPLVEGCITRLAE